MSTIDQLWHLAYCQWFDHNCARHRARAAAWGWLADLLVTVTDRLGRKGGRR